MRTRLKNETATGLRFDRVQRRLALARAWAADPGALPEITTAVTSAVHSALMRCDHGTVRRPKFRS